MQWAILATLPLVLVANQDQKPKEKKKMEVIVKKPDKFLRDRINVVEFTPSVETASTHMTVMPRADVDIVRLGSNRFGVAGKAGKYMLFAMTWSNEKGGYDPTETEAEFEIVDLTPKPEPKPEPKPKPKKAPDPNPLILRVSIGGAGCSGVAVSAVQAEMSRYVLTAAHCIPSGFKSGSVRLGDGPEQPVDVVAVDVVADCAILVLRSPNDTLPCAWLAESTPADGTAVRHAGYGVDRPRSVEDGTLTQRDTGHSQTEFRLSVSSGDSGGPIWSVADNLVCSTVCCTTERGKVARVFGASAESIERVLDQAVLARMGQLLPQSPAVPKEPQASVAGWKPLEIPLRK